MQRPDDASDGRTQHGVGLAAGRRQGTGSEGGALEAANASAALLSDGVADLHIGGVDGGQPWIENADIESDAEDGGVVRSAAHGQRPLQRDAIGTFTGGQRNCRKQEAPAFHVIQVALQEAADCGQSSSCASTPCCAAHGGTQCRQWLIRGPVLGWSDDAVHLMTTVTVRAALWLPAAEVYVRAMPHLVPVVYAHSTAAHNSVRFVASERTAPAYGADVDPTQCSFRGLAVGRKLLDKEVKEVIKRAAASLLAAKGKFPRGHMSLALSCDARGDVVLKSALRAVLRTRSIGAAKDFRNKGAALVGGRTADLHGLLGPGAVGRIRRHLELQDKLVPGSRATRLRVAWGLSKMRLLPAREQLQRHRREAIDAPGRVAHYFLTHSVLGSLERWDYILGSGLAGIMRYKT